MAFGFRLHCLLDRGGRDDVSNLVQETFDAPVVAAKSSARRTTSRLSLAAELTEIRQTLCDFIECRAAQMGRQVFGTHMVYRETFLQIQQRLLQHLVRKSRILGAPHVMSESQTPVQDQRCQSGPSARNSVIPSEGDFSKNYGADQQRLQISDPLFDKFLTPATFAC